MWRLSGCSERKGRLVLRLTREDPAPLVLRSGSGSRQNAEERIATVIQSGGVPSAKDFRSLWAQPAVREKLWRMHNGRCCYCERLRDRGRESDVEHFRPKTAVAEKTPQRPGYWWLAYEWKNLLLACKTCNEQYKRTHFPVRGTRATGPDDDLEHEDAYLLNPIDDDIDTVIGFDWESRPGGVLMYGVGEDGERGLATVRIVGLNRTGLVKERWESLQPLRRIAWNMIRAIEMGNMEPYVARVAAEIRDMTSRQKATPFVAMKRKFFRSYGLGEFVAAD